MIEQAGAFLVQVAFALAILGGGWVATKLIVNFAKRNLTKREVDLILVNFVGLVLTWVLTIVVVIAALSAVGINTTSLVAMLGALTVAIGLALQDTVKNFAAGILMVFFRPFQLDDYVEAGDATGIVEEITLFTTLLRTPDNRSVIVPNGTIYADTITNHSARETRRIDMVFGIGYDDDIRKARQIMAEILEADERVLANPEPVIAVGELADSSVNFNVRPWVKTEEYWDVRADLLERIKLAFDANDISIPYPQMDVHLNGTNGETA